MSTLGQSCSVLATSALPLHMLLRESACTLDLKLTLPIPRACSSRRLVKPQLKSAQWVMLPDALVAPCDWGNDARVESFNDWIAQLRCGLKLRPFELPLVTSQKSAGP